jgi:DNA-binding transcriptional regulator YiaG
VRHLPRSTAVNAFGRGLFRAGGAGGRVFAVVQSMLGTELRSRRLRIGCSRNQVAHELGVDAPTLQAWESDGEPIACPSAVEQVLRKLEAQHDDIEESLRTHLN